MAGADGLSFGAGGVIRRSCTSTACQHETIHHLAGENYTSTACSTKRSTTPQAKEAASTACQHKTIHLAGERSYDIPSIFIGGQQPLYQPRDRF